jgi:ATP-dependent DNA helicase RecQ
MTPLDVLQSIFGYRSFREGQREIVDAVLAGRDVFAVMPTGSGKSLCYQLPAIAGGGLTLVVSPLLALMRDQVKDLRRLGVEAAALNSMSAPAEADETWGKIKEGRLRLLFVSPERLAMEGLAETLSRHGVRRLAIDEAHCISQWGHDFRPEYRMLPAIRERLGRPPVIALTATADRATRADIQKALFQAEPLTFVHSFDRPNLSLAFAPKDQPRRQIADFIARQGKVSGIVYCGSRDRTEKLAAHLSAQGFDALAYHAGMDPRARERNQDRFLQDDRVVMCATIAFGMGVNKPDVRFVMHADMPGSIESYYQEIGRAGRDGLPAATLTLYGGDDMSFARRRILAKDLTDEQRRIEQKRLQAMIDLCESALCRRRAVLSYFGEELAACGGCDLCKGAARTVDGTEPARKLLSAAWRTGQRFGGHHLAEVLIGNATEAVTRNQHDALPTFGVGKERPKAWWLTFARKCVAAGLLEETDGDRPGLRLTEAGDAVLRGRRPFEMRDDGEPAATRSGRLRARDGKAIVDAALEEPDQRLLEALKRLRRELAAEEGVAAFMIFADRSLIDMVRLKPLDRHTFSLVHGVGERKLEAYGERFMKAIAAETR